MIKYLKDKMLALTEVAGIEINISGDDKLLIHAVHLKNENGKIKKINELTNLKDFEQLKSKLDINIPLCVAISGKGILIRKGVAGNSNTISDFLPGINPNDFYAEKLILNEDSQHLFITKKEVIIPLLQQLQSMGFSVIYLTLGLAAIGNVLPFLSGDIQYLITTQSYVFSNNAKETNIGSHSKEIDFHTEELLLKNQYFKQVSIVAFSVALEPFITSLSTLSGGYEEDTIIKTRKELADKKIFRFAGWTCLLGFFLILLINYFVFNYYYNKNTELNESASQLLQRQKEYESQKKQLDSSVSFMSTLGWDLSSKHSYHLDRIAALVPGSVVLTSLQSSPTIENTESNVQLFDNKKILVSGTCDQPTDLNDFVNAVKNLPETRTVTLKNYVYKKEKATAIFMVEIEHE